MALHLLAVAAIVVAVSPLAPSAAGYPWPVCGIWNNNFKPKSRYQTNLNLLAATLPKNASASQTLYATAVVGAIPEQVWGMGLCRGDTNASSCLNCLTQAFQDLTNECSYNKDATIYYDQCILHYSDVHTLPDDDTGPSHGMYTVSNNNNVTSDPGRFMSLLAALTNTTFEHAANDSTRRFATGEADFDKDFPKVYTLAQCVPEQTPAQCHKCLTGIVVESLAVFQSSIGGRVLGFNCSYRYETAPFFNGPATVRLASPSSGAPAPVPTVGTPAAAGGGTLLPVALVEESSAAAEAPEAGASEPFTAPEGTAFEPTADTDPLAQVVPCRCLYMHGSVICGDAQKYWPRVGGEGLYELVCSQ
ncbi:hypothetical protein BS78_02G303000 [Paspalum vaginatum]|nr:hypothetical protein BS78_02G303000 [Paspalum vaginatum]